MKVYQFLTRNIKKQKFFSSIGFLEITFCVETDRIISPVPSIFNNAGP